MGVRHKKNFRGILGVQQQHVADSIKCPFVERQNTNKTNKGNRTVFHFTGPSTTYCKSRSGPIIKIKSLLLADRSTLPESPRNNHAMGTPPPVVAGHKKIQAKTVFMRFARECYKPPPLQNNRMDVSKNGGTPKSSILKNVNRVFH